MFADAYLTIVRKKAAEKDHDADLLRFIVPEERPIVSRPSMGLDDISCMDAAMPRSHDANTARPSIPALRVGPPLECS